MSTTKTRETPVFLDSTDVGGSRRPRVRPRGQAVCVGGYYVDAAHVTPTSVVTAGTRPRPTAHVEAWQDFERERGAVMGCCDTPF